MLKSMVSHGTIICYKNKHECDSLHSSKEAGTNFCVEDMSSEPSGLITAFESKVPFSEALIGLGVVPNITSPSFFFISFKEVYIFISLYSDENTTKKLALWTLKKCCYDHISYNLCKPKISKHPILVFTVYMEFKYIQICVEYMKPIPDNICILILIALWIIFWRFWADELAF